MGRQDHHATHLIERVNGAPPQRTMMKETSTRCPWAASEEMWRYHDLEWGVPVHDDRTHFEFLILEGAQAGLSWSTILRKREGYRRAFASFDAEKVARFTARQIERALDDPGIVRNRLKVASAVSNARVYLSRARSRAPGAGTTERRFCSLIHSRTCSGKAFCRFGSCSISRVSCA